MVNKKIVYTLRTLEILIQSVFFLSITITLYFALIGGNSSGLFYCFLSIIPIVVLYFCRKKIRKFFWFMIPHLMFLVASFFIGTSDSEHFFYVVIMLILAIYSIRLKMIDVQKGDISQIPIYDGVIDQVERESNLQSMQSDEHLPNVLVCVMIVCYMIGNALDSQIVKTSQVVLFILFVVAQILYQDLKKLNEVYIRNADKSEFPVHQLKNVNTFIIITSIVLILVGMFLFYSGLYGNAFAILGSAIGGGIRYLLKLIIFLMRNNSAGDTSTVDTTEQTTEALNLDFETGVAQNNMLAQVAAEVFATMLIIAAVVGVVYLLMKYIRNFNHARQQGADFVESIHEDTRKRKYDNRKKNDGLAYPKTEKDNIVARKVYKKKVKEGYGPDRKPDGTIPPEVLTRETITSDHSDASKVTEIYEKARYSNENITKEELELLKNIKKDNKST